MPSRLKLFAYNHVYKHLLMDMQVNYVQLFICIDFWL